MVPKRQIPTSTHRNLKDVLTDRDLASLGDSLVNFIFSLALSKRSGKPVGAKVKGSILAEALKRADLRSCLPSRMSKHVLADAAEALIAYGWLMNCMTLEESVDTIAKEKDVVEGLRQLLLFTNSRLTFP